MTGHGETFRPMPGHYHFSHVETLKGHDTPGAGDVLVAEPEQLDRLQLALNEIGFEMRITSSWPRQAPFRPIAPSVAEIGPRTALAAGRSGSAGRISQERRTTVMLIDPLFSLGAGICKAVCSVRSACRANRPSSSIHLNHFRTDPDKVAVPLLSAASDHRASRAYGVSQVRPIHVGPAAGRRIHQCACRQQPG